MGNGQLGLISNPFRPKPTYTLMMCVMCTICTNILSEDKISEDKILSEVFLCWGKVPFTESRGPLYYFFEQIGRMPFIYCLRITIQSCLLVSSYC